MNEYLVEDEYSFYEIDPDCKIGMEKKTIKREKRRRTEQCDRNEDRVGVEERRSSRRGCLCCSKVLLSLLCLKIWSGGANWN